MRFTAADVLSAAHRSLATAGAHDRSGWLALFTADATVEDPLGSQPHRGQAALGRFYDTFIGPRAIDHRPGQDLVVGSTVLRDLELQITMAASLTMRVPAYLRYDLREDGGELKIAALSAYWELPAMIGQFLRGGPAAAPAGLALGRAMAGNQGLVGTLGFLGGFRGSGTGAKALAARLLHQACGGDEVGVRRLAARAQLTRGDSDPLTTSELVKQLSGGVPGKIIRSGRAVAARVDRDGQPRRPRCIVIADIGADRAVLSRIRLFGEPG